MITIKDMVSMRYGKEIADDLAADGLLATTTDASEITGWRVKVKDTGNVVLPTRLKYGGGSQSFVPHSLGSCLSAPLWWYQYGSKDYRDQTEDTRPLESSQDYPSEMAARRQAKMAAKCGLEVEIVPLSLVELPLLKFVL